MKKNTLTVSIVTWNSSLTIDQCVGSILVQSYSDFELVVVDNNSRDDSITKIEMFRDSRIRVLKMMRNSGFCVGHNNAIRNSRSEFILLVNPDVILKHDFFELALDVMHTAENIGTVCGLLLQNEPDAPTCLVDSAGLMIGRDRRCLLRFHGHSLKGLTLGSCEVFGADGALPMYRRTMVDDVSVNGEFFDERFFAHKEDWDVAWRSRLYGWRTVFSPSCIAIHPRQFKPSNVGVRKTMTNEVKRDAVKNQFLLIIKNEQWLNFIMDFPRIVARQMLVFIYLLFFETSSISAYWHTIHLIPEMMKRRKEIQSRRLISATDMRKWFQEAHRLRKYVNASHGKM